MTSRKLCPLRGHHSAWAGFSPMFTSSAKNYLSILHFVGFQENVKDKWITSAEIATSKQTKRSRSCSAWILPSQFSALDCPLAVGKQLLNLHTTGASSKNLKHITIIKLSSMTLSYPQWYPNNVSFLSADDQTLSWALGKPHFHTLVTYYFISSCVGPSSRTAQSESELGRLLEAPQ